MKKILFVIPLVLIIIFLAFTFNKKQVTSISYNNLNLKNKDNVFIMLYYPPQRGEYLIPEGRNTIFEKSIEYTLMKNLFSGTSSKNARGIAVELKNIKVEGSTAYIMINSKSNIEDSIYDIYSIVNTLTEVPGINKVMITLNGRDISKGGFTRNRTLFNRDKNLNPSEVIYKQMQLEQQGKWIDSYLLMSDNENDRNRKYFDTYVKELQEMKDVDFLNQNFVVGSYTVSNNLAKVKVNFYTKDVSGKKIFGEDLYFKCVKINGVWMVDWLTSQ